MARITPELNAFIQARADDGLDRHEVADIAREISRTEAPLDTMHAVFARYGPQFTAEGAQAFGVAARVLGEDRLAEVADIFETTRSAVRTARETIGAVEAELEGLEADNRARAEQVRRLAGQIETRKDAIKAAREKKRTVGIAAALLGVPAVSAVSLIKMQQDDAKLQSLERDKKDAEASRARVDGKIAAHQRLKESLHARLGRLQRAEDKLGADLDVAAPAVARSFAAVAQSAARLTQGQRLLSNLQSQLVILEEMRDSAQGLGAELDAVIATLQQKVVRADELVRSSEAALHQLVDLATSKDPQAAATAWLERKLAHRTRKLMQDLDMDLDRYIDHLVTKSFPLDTPEAALLRDRLKAGFREAIT